MHAITRVGLTSVLFFTTAIAIAGPNDPGPAPAPNNPPNQPAFTVSASTTTNCGSPMKTTVRLTRAVATANPVSGKIVFGPVGANTVVAGFTLEAGRIGTVTSIPVTHPQVLDCTATLPDAVLEVWVTGAGSAMYKRQLMPKSFFGEKLTGGAPPSGPWLAKVVLTKATCGGGANGSVHLEAAGAGPFASTVAMTFAGATVSKSVTVPYPNPLADPSWSAPGPINCKAATGLPPFTWNVQPGGNSGSYGPAGYAVTFGDS